MITIYDCSNSHFRPQHREVSRGPIQNDIMHDLKKYAHNYGCYFVDALHQADAVLTNDVFTPEVLNSGKPLIKRMDGIFFQQSLQDRNFLLNAAAVQADHVIFISEYSRESYYRASIEPLKASSVILNTVDETIFNPGMERKARNIWIANASNWSRPEKRLSCLLALAKNIPEEIYLIGEVDVALPKNVLSLGYLTDYTKIARILRAVTGFINLSYRDAAPKTVCQALACGLPVLYANSGGLSELVPHQMGVAIPDSQEVSVEEFTPALDLHELLQSYQTFLRQHGFLSEQVQRHYRPKHQETISRYLEIIKHTVRRKNNVR